MAKKMKSPKKLERHFKGVANHRRIQILLLLDKNPDMTLENIIDELEANQKTISGHTHRLVIAGLVEKSYQGRSVLHRLTPYGKEFAAFIKEFSKHGAGK